MYYLSGQKNVDKDLINAELNRCREECECDPVKKVKLSNRFISWLFNKYDLVEFTIHFYDSEPEFDYDENDLYPLFNYSNEEILELLSKYNIKIDELNKEQYGLENNKIEILNNYYYNYEKFMESSKEDVQFILTFVHKQNMLKTKIIPSLNDMKNMEKYI